ncbi:MAG TPA: nucleoside deaminase [Candidatus Saccharimonadales bacterium]|nr:nucleoside deaminase [Candidatus Saccharimonadales bacterium]
MKSSDEYMQAAIAAAEQAAASNGVAIGAVLVDRTTGEIVATGGSMVGPTKDPTAHAEVNAIRSAAQKFHTDDLYGLALYSTLEPCHMCLSAAAWARIPEVYFGAYKKDVDASLFDIKGDFSDEVEGGRMNLREKTSMKVQGGILEAECAQLLADYGDRNHHNRPAA